MTPDGFPDLVPPGSLEDAIRATDALALVIDRAGRIAAHNRQWLETGVRHGLDPMAIGVGTDYLALCDRATGRDADYARRAAEGIRAVLAGESSMFHLDYPCHGPDERRWFTLRVAPLAGPGSSVLASHVDITATRQAEYDIRGELHGLWSLVDPEAEFVLLFDDAACVTQGGFGGPLGVHDQPPIGTNGLDLVHPVDRTRAAAAFKRCITVPDHREQVDVRGFCSDDGEWRHVQLTMVNMLDDPEVGAVVVSGRDLTDRLRAGMADMLADELMDKLPVAAIATDADGIILSVNDGAAALLGAPVDHMIGRGLRSFAVPVSPEGPEGFRDVVDAESVWIDEIDIRRRDGTQICVLLQVRPLVDPKTGLQGRSYLAIDRTEARQLRETLFYRNHHDLLTGLANREGLVAHVEAVGGETDQDHVRAVAVVSLDSFREINTRLGTEFGDFVLQAVGQALQRCVGEAGKVARLYGDVFALVTGPGPDVSSLSGSIAAALESVAPAVGAEFVLRASVGLRLVTAPHAGVGAVDDAVAAAAEVKQAGGHGYRLFDEALRASVEDRVELQRDLQHAVERNELVVEYQPVVRLDDGTVVGVEALVRWEHPTRGRLAPDLFIPLAERIGAIGGIGMFVLDDVCRQAARWRDMRSELPMRAAINLSAAQLEDPELATLVRTAIARYHLDPATITIELTESMLMEESGSARRRLAELKAVGVRLAIDDFGTGYSSLGRFKGLPLDVVKIDRSFVSGAARCPEDASIIKTIIGLADAFGVDAIAEGVETADEGRALRDAGCHLGQGFVWSPAVPAPEIDTMLHRPFDAMPISASQPAAPVEAYTDALRTIQHELATPLAVLNASVSMLDAEGHILDDMHGPIVRGVHRVSRLVESLDLVDRLDRGTLTVSARRQDLEALARQTAGEVSFQLSTPIVVEGSGEIAVEVEGPLVEQVIVNLLTNAVKYSPSGSPVVVTVGAHPGSVWLEVRDQGPGIPLDKLGTVWRKFGRLDHSVSGSGIGLYLARGIARAHGGDLRYRAGEPSGSVFRLELPVDDQS